MEKKRNAFRHTRLMRIALVAVILLVAWPANSQPRGIKTVVAQGKNGRGDKTHGYILSPIWEATIQQWAVQIDLEARKNGLDPDFIAAVINAESNGNQYGISRAGAVGLMGVMPAGPGLEWRPSAEILADPAINLSWGVAILAEVVQQSGGDIAAALAAYAGGWDYVNSRVPREYANRVLDEYGRAVASRAGVSPDIASQWTVATEITRGHIPMEPLILPREPVSGLHTYGGHLVYHFVDENGHAYYVKGYAVPLALVRPVTSDTAASGDSVDTQLLVRLGLAESKMSKSNPRVILACLPSLGRLRGRLSTRWFAPSSCPSWHR
ncbi:MAG: transglycosylase SLT domain-containing protein [Chloroflexi bacterium]|nr:transglycosylase SLT domain-containing protein [Chloroflexota bacterium]MCI0577331.1 transglycosylase SLT domain-containing protein [Chloroflexota bacterium]MCI0648131.1 transglycosylase SLT domain-containing protein [Chloroflexota bacterium]MCI0725989.1 transglycosylase SLT domain-containing protein [Chloroflexota bacterium]